MDAFWQLYSEKRIEKITIKDITIKAGYNRSTFYKYFTDVYDVLEQIESSILPDLEKHKDILMDTNKHLSLIHITEVYNRNKKYFVVLLGKNGDPAFHEKIKNVYKELIRPSFQSIYTDDLTLEYTLEYMMSAFIGVLTYCFTQEEDPDIQKLIQILWNLMHNEHSKIVNLMF
ncbi:hypothetical protein CSC2_43410 [Clostridium zeae]|uniref:HTH tetR-type domain-containing protein n=1 Tax=Clostridium zeae TaxID=2759022 RepID=A0ABQ1EG88_9CLOT|nr:TetR/AcrR family transcriptional regulator [Clostridium zeae]GFZ33815.1 hypothetical protein CSC2_43410 [Clostridium zeae]